MLHKICFGIFAFGYGGALIEGFVLEKSINSFIIVMVTGVIMTLAIITTIAVNQFEKRL